MATKIEWADLTINPVVGCSKCSPGCDNCYAERFAARLAKNPTTAAKYAGVVDEHGKWTGKISMFDSSCFKKLPKTPKRIFVGSMCDIFHEDIKRAYGDYWKSYLPYLFDCMDSYSQHIFMLLTKRPENMKRWIDFAREACTSEIMPNLWLGVTVCNQEEADAKIPVLLQTPAAKRFVSVEPMLGPVDLSQWVFNRRKEVLRLTNGPACLNYDQADASVAYPLDWVICGGETGPNARPMYPDWVRSLRDQCASAGVPFFFKGWGEWAQPQYINDIPVWDGKTEIMVRGDASTQKIHSSMHRIGKKRAGRLLDGHEWMEVPHA